MTALVPAAFVLWRGTRLARMADDPALPERLLAARSQNGAVLGASVALLSTTMARHAIWALPLLVVARICAGYPLRKIVYRETWSLGGCLSFFTRLIVAVFGFWILLGVTPALLAIPHSHEGLAAGVMAVVLCLWASLNARIFRVILHARPVADSAIASRFADMTRTCSLPPVALEQVDMRGGVFANAVALPATRGSAVVISSTLLDRLDRDETIAILAHELAHIEHHHPQRLRRMGAAMLVLVAIAALLSTLLRVVAPSATLAVMVAWPGLLVATMMIVARHRQKHETASDLRAIELTGDPAALIRALTKLHAFAHIPRRWDVEWERNATHPSLARRIQAIERAAGSAPASLAEPATFVASDGAVSVTFHDDRVVWNEGATSHAIEYLRLTSLRIATKTSDAPRLVAIDTAHRRWEMVLRPTDVARAQATLDIVDTRLAAAPERRATPAVPQRALAMLALLAVAIVGQTAAMIVAIAAAVLPGVPLTAAAGAASIGVAAIVLRDHPPGGIDWRPWAALICLVVGCSLIAVSVARRREDISPAATKLVAALAVLTVIVWILVGLAGFSAVDLHRQLRAWPSAAVLMLSLGGALAFAPPRAARRSSGFAIAVGVAAIFIGSIGFLDRFGNDPFLGSPGAVVVRAIDGSSVRDEFNVPFPATEMSLSPNGRYASFKTEDENEDITIHAGPIHGPYLTFAVDQAIFVDDGRLLVVDWRRGACALRLVDLDQPDRELWSRRVPITAAHASVDRATRRWRLLGWNAARDIVSVSGGIGGDDLREETWNRVTSDGAFVRPLAVANGRMLGIEVRSAARWQRSVTMIRLAALVQPEYRTVSRFWAIRPDGASSFATSHLDVRCVPRVRDQERVTCAAYDGSRTGIFAVDAASHQMTALASMAGRFFLHGAVGGGGVTGWWDHATVLVEPAARVVIRVEAADRPGPNFMAAADGTVAALWSNGDQSTVRLYSFD